MKIIDIIYKKILRIMGEIKLYKYPIFVIYDPYEYKVNGNDWKEFVEFLKPGDIVLRAYDHYLIGDIIPGRYSHAGLYIGDNTIIHAVGNGISKIHIFDFAKCDGLAIIRPTVSSKVITRAIIYAKNQIGKNYDFYFNFEDETSYSCTELIYWCYKDAINIKPIEFTKFFGLIKHLIIAPDSFLYDDKCSIIWESESNYRK